MAIGQMTTIQKDFARTNKLIYAWPKTGKSSFAAQLVDQHGRVPLFAATEDGLGSLSVSACRVTSWTGFLKFLDWVEGPMRERLANEHSCVVLDLVSDLDSWCSTAVAKKKGVEYVGDLDQGKGWKLLRDEFQANISRLMQICPVTFIAHCAEKRIQWQGQEIITQAPDLSKAALSYVNGKVSAIMYIEPAGQKKDFPTITLAPSIAHIAGAHQRAICRAFTYNPANAAATYNEIARIYAEAQASIPANETGPIITDPAAAQPAVAAQ